MIHWLIFDFDVPHFAFLREDVGLGSIADQQMIWRQPFHVCPRATPITGPSGAMIVIRSKDVAAFAGIFPVLQNGNLGGEPCRCTTITLEQNSGMATVGR